MKFQKVLESVKASVGNDGLVKHMLASEFAMWAQAEYLIKMEFAFTSLAGVSTNMLCLR